MKTKINIIITVILIIFLVLPNTVLCMGIGIDTNLYQPTSPEGYEEFTKIGSNYIGIIQYVGIILAVIMLITIGIKYMAGSIEEKAEYKKTMIPYVIGCAILISSSVLVGFIGNAVGTETSTGTSTSTDTSTSLKKEEDYIIYYCKTCGNKLDIETERIAKKCSGCKKEKIMGVSNCYLCGNTINSTIGNMTNATCFKCADQLYCYTCGSLLTRSFERDGKQCFTCDNNNKTKFTNCTECGTHIESFTGTKNKKCASCAQ